MEEAPTYNTVREAVASIKGIWPDAAGWDEVLELERLLPAESSLLNTALLGTAKEKVKRLLERLSTAPLPSVPPRPFGKCEVLAHWVPFDLKG